MHRFTKTTKCVSIVLTLWFCMMYVPVQSIFAAVVKTETVLAGGEILITREKVRAFLDRSDVQAALTARGIDPSEAKARVNSLSDAEVKKIAAKIDELPAGGNALGFVVVAALVFFLVLLITDMLGFTDIFTFINPPRK
ncbi:MAG: PA2779 family protein [Desulfobacteraceae bacterium]